MAQNTANTVYQQAIQFHRQGQVVEARQAYEAAIELDPNFDSPYINLGLLLISIGQFSEAQTYLEEVLNLPDRPESPASVHALAHYNLAIIYHRQGNAKVALQEVREALAIAPKFSRAQQFLEQLRSQ